jgi:hypothetical protein
MFQPPPRQLMPRPLVSPLALPAVQQRALQSIGVNCGFVPSLHEVELRGDLDRAGEAHRDGAARGM